MAEESIGSTNVATVSAERQPTKERQMDPELAQVERHERAVVVRPHAEGPARVEHEQGGTIRSEPTEDLDGLGRVDPAHVTPVR